MYGISAAVLRNMNQFFNIQIGVFECALTQRKGLVSHCNMSTIYIIISINRNRLYVHLL